MSAREWTPGPLEVGYYQPTPVFQGISEHVAVMRPDGELVALTGSTRSEDRETSEADARLYASAPDLYEALEPLAEVSVRDCPWGCDVYHRDECPVMRARAVLAKARGER